jgi:tRNA 2-thiocytidine biosynthesis protein TtcA
MIQDWEKQWPGRTESLFRSLQNVAPSQLADPNLFNFQELEEQRLSADEISRDGDENESTLEDEFNPAAHLAIGHPVLGSSDYEQSVSENADFLDALVAPRA